MKDAKHECLGALSYLLLHLTRSLSRDLQGAYHLGPSVYGWRGKNRMILAMGFWGRMRWRWPIMNGACSVQVGKLRGWWGASLHWVWRVNGGLCPCDPVFDFFGFIIRYPTLLGSTSPARCFLWSSLVTQNTLIAVCLCWYSCYKFCYRLYVRGELSGLFSILAHLISAIMIQ